MNYNSLKSDIAAVVKQNGNQEITGENLQGVLTEMIDNSVGTGYLYKGIATPETQGGTPDQNVLYLAGAGIYPNFAGTNVPKGYIGIFSYNGVWSYNILKISESDIFDISEYNNTSYANLSAALNGNNIPVNVRKGGMSVKFVQTSDNKYVQYLYIGTSTDIAEFTNMINWMEMTLEDKINIFQPATSVDFSDDVLELWLVKTPTSDVKLQSYNNEVYLVFQGGTIARNLSISDNNVAYEIKVYHGATEEYPNGTIVGYIVFRDIASFKSKSSSSNMQSINVDRCLNLANSPITAFSTGNCIAKNTTIATSAINTTNCTNVVDASIPHSAFVKELYLFGSGVDTTKTYTIEVVARNHSTYGWSICIAEKNGSSLTIKAYLLKNPTEPNNPVLIPEYNHSGISAYAIVNWDEFVDGSNNSTNILLTDRVFDLNYSPIIGEMLRVNEVIAASVEELDDKIDSIGEDEVVYKNDAQDLDNTSVWSSTQRGFACMVPNCKNKSFNTVDIPYIGDGLTEENPCVVVIGQTDSTTYGGTLFRDAFDSANKLAETELILGSNNGYKTVTLPTECTVTKNTLAVFAYVKNSTAKIKSVYQTSSSGMSQNTAYKDADGKWYAISGGSVAYSYGAYPIITNVSSIATKEYVEQRIEEVEGYVDFKVPTKEIVLPDKITVVVGDELQLFYRSIIKANNYEPQSILLSCNKGKQFPRFFDYTPVSGDVGTTTLNVKLRNDKLETIAQKTCTLRIVGNGSSPATQKNVVCIGDSLTTNGEWVTELSRMLTGSGGTPAGRNFDNITFCGAHGSGNAKYFGVGGWQWSSYATAGMTAYRFFVSGVNSLSHFAQYTNNGSTFRIIEINVTEGVGNILCQLYSGSSAPASSGTLTKSSGSGDATITYSSVVQAPGNPFWDSENEKISFIDYANTYCNGTIDVVYAVLGGNGLSPNKTDFTAVKGYIHDFADALHTEFPNAKLKLGGTACMSFNGGAGANEGATGTSYADGMGIFYAMLNINKAYQEIANEVGYSSFVEYVDIISQFDNEYNMQHNDFPVNTRNSQTERRDTNEMHPAIEGYYQIADVIYRNFIAEFCQST